MSWKGQIKKNLRDRMGARLSTYDNTPKTQEIRQKLKELRKRMLDMFDSASNNSDLELFEEMLPKIKSLIDEMEIVNMRQRNETTRRVRSAQVKDPR